MFTRGTANADVLNGGSGDDTLYGLGGNDKINGGAGNDVLTGDAGDDSVVGGAGEDYLMGGAGNDTLDGGADADWASYEDATSAVKVDLNLTTAQNTLGGGTDVLKNIENLQGSVFNDILIGNNGVNYLYGGAGNDSLFGGNGDDHFEGGAGDDTINGGNGDDVVSYEDGLAGGVTIDLNLTTGQANGAHGTDTLISIEAIWGSAFDDTFTGNAADNYIYGGAGNDLIRGGAGADALDGGVGNDTILGGQGADNLTGGAGNDLFKFADGDSGVFNSAGGVAAGTTDVINDFAGGTRGTGTANGTGDTLDFGIVQGTAANYVENTAATSTAAAAQANSAFLANSALRYVATQVGADTLVFASDANGGEAHNLVTLKGVSTAAIGFNSIAGMAAVNPHLIIGTDGADSLVGTNIEDTIYGLGGADTINGGGGNDLIVSGLGADTLIGGSGNDVFAFPQGESSLQAPDVISDFEGGTRARGDLTNNYGDMLDFGLTRASATNYLENSAATLTDAKALAGALFAANAHLRYIATTVDTNLQVFASDADGGEAHSLVTITGGSGDTFGPDSIVGTPPPVSPNSVFGSNGADSLIGTASSDTIEGLGGNDTIIGGAGSDVLAGGAHVDLFVFSRGDSGTLVDGQLQPGGFDIITDFVFDVDQIRLGFGPLGSMTSAIRPDFESALSTANSALQVGALNGNPDHVAVIAVGSDTYVFVDYDGFSNADMVIKLQGVVANPADLFAAFV